MNSFSVVETSIAAIHNAYRTGATTVRQVINAHLARIDAYDKRGPYLNTVINLLPDARQRADEQDVWLAAHPGEIAGPLFGVPVVIKDNVEVAGVPMTAGFQGWKHNIPGTDAPIVRLIREAGGIVLAKTSMSEFARGGHDNINSVLPGFARNPYQPAYSTGGSSGGTAAALAASFAVVGIGTDTGGSIRMPSAHNALVGLRPSMNLVNFTGVVPLDLNRDTVGPMARAIEDLAVLLDVLNPGRSARDALSVDALRGARLGVFRQAFEGPYTDPRITAHFGDTLEELRTLGAELVDPFDVPGFDTIPRPPQTPARVRWSLEQYLDARPATRFTNVQTIADSGLLHPLHQPGFEQIAATLPQEEDSATLTGAANERRYRELIEAAMTASGVEALVLPTWARLPALNGDRNTQDIDEPMTVLPPFPEAAPTTYQSSLTYLASALQWPALAVPTGFLGEGLPVGIQIVAAPQSEQRLIALGYAYEQGTRHRTAPPTTPPLTHS
jgi:amidase